MRESSVPQLLLLFLLILSFPVLAQERVDPEHSGRVVEYVSEEYTEVVVAGSIGGESYDFSIRESAAEPVVSWGRQVLEVEKQLNSQLERAFRDFIDEKIDGATVRNWSFRRTGPLTLKLTADNGVVKASFGGFSLYATAKVRYSRSIKIKARIVTDVIWVNGTYDVVTGVAKLSLPEDFFVDVNFDIDAVPLEVLYQAGEVAKCVVKYGDLNYCLANRIFSKTLSAQVEDFASDWAESAAKEIISSYSSREFVFYGLQEAFSNIPSTAGLEVSDLSQEVRGQLSLGPDKWIAITVDETYLDLGVDSASRYCYSNRGWSYGRSVVISVVSIKLDLPTVSLTARNGVDTSYRRDCDGTCPQSVNQSFCVPGPLDGEGQGGPFGES